MRKLGLIAVFLVAACGSVNVAHAQTLTLAYKAGDTYRYALHAVFKYTLAEAGMSMPLSLEFGAKEKLKVNSVDATGTADITISLSDTSVKETMGGTTNTTTNTTGGDIDVKVASDGRIVSINGTAIGSGSLPGMPGTQGGLVSAILPDGSVKPGDSWTKSYEQQNPVGSGSIHVASRSTYLRDEKLGGVSTAVVQSNITTTLDLMIDASAMLGQPGMPMIPATPSPAARPIGAESITITGTSIATVTSWVDAGAHRVVKTHSTSTVDATLTVTMPAAEQTSPMLTGPITVKGTQTLDMSPA